jgi:DNA polymerase-3 subunit epsilon
LKYAIIDIETTGGSFKTGRITEVAVYLHSGAKLLDEYSTLINPEVPIPPFVAKLTGISDKLVSTAPTFAEIAEELLRITAGAVFVAHNANFDYSFVKEEYRRLGMDFRMKRLCTVQLSRKTFPGLPSYSLDKLTKELGIALDGHHRATVDALATLKVFEKILEKQNTPHIFESYSPIPDLSGVRSPLITPEIIRSIPDECGVYRFFNAEDETIYVKRSDNMLTSICERLGNLELEMVRRMRADLYRIEYTETGSALLAQLIEADMVLREHPRYNHGKFSLKIEYGIYLQDYRGVPHLVLQRKRSRHEAIMYFASFYEGLELLRYRSKEWDLPVSEIPLGRKPVPAIALTSEADMEAGVYDLQTGHYVIEDEGRHIDEKTLILVEHGIPVGFGYFDYTMEVTALTAADLQFFFEPRAELELVVRKFLEKKRFERILRLDD